MRQVCSAPFEDGSGAVEFAVRGLGPLRLRTVALVSGGVRGRRRLTSRRRLLRFADAVDAKRLPVALPGVGAAVDDDPATPLPYGILRAPGGDVPVVLPPLSSAARGAALA